MKNVCRVCNVKPDLPYNMKQATPPSRARRASTAICASLVRTPLVVKKALGGGSASSDGGGGDDEILMAAGGGGGVGGGGG